MSSAHTILGILADIAMNTPDAEAVVLVDADGEETVLGHAALGHASDAVAARLRELGIGRGDVVVLGIPNDVHYFSLLVGIWKAGATALPISPWLSTEDRTALVRLAGECIGRAVLVDVAPVPGLPTIVHTTPAGVAASTLAAPEPALPARARPADTAPPFLYVTSGGSTGLPKIVPMPLRWVAHVRSPHAQPDDDGPPLPDRTRLLCGDLYHTGTLTLALHVLVTGAAVVTQNDFRPATFLEILRRRSIYYVFLTPFHMRAVLALDEIDRSVFDGVARFGHGGAPCPVWVKRGWIDLVGAARIFESYTSSELSSASRPVRVSGEEWLRKPGTVGKGHDVRIVDENGDEVPAGEVGEIYTATSFGAANAYVGARDLRVWRKDPAYVSVADLGWVDEDGYLFIADRMSDVVHRGDAVVFPKRVEEVIGEHPDVADVAVVGVTGPDGGQHVLALVQPRGTGRELTEEVLRAHWDGKLTRAEVPDTVRFTAKLPRTPEGKMRKSVVRDLVTTRHRDDEYRFV